MQINTRSIKSRFEKSMTKYDENAIVQTQTAKELVFELSKLGKNFDTIIELGCGTGLLTKQIKENMTFSAYYANDLVEKSKNYISEIIPSAIFITGNAQKIKVPRKADLLVSNAMFQWFSRVSDIADCTAKMLNKGGILAFSTFGKDNFREIKETGKISLEYASAEDLTSELSKKYEILYIDEYTKTLNFNNPLEILTHMKNTGVNSLSAKTWSIKDIKTFCEKYLEKYKTVQLSYNPIIIIAKLK